MGLILAVKGVDYEGLAATEIDNYAKRLESALPRQSCAQRPAQAHQQCQLRRGTARLSDFLCLPFVFINILALFRRIQVEKSRVEGRGVTNRYHPTRPLELAPQLLNSSTPHLLDCLFS